MDMLNVSFRSEDAKDLSLQPPGCACGRTFTKPAIVKVAYFAFRFNNSVNLQRCSPWVQRREKRNAENRRDYIGNAMLSVAVL